ncbi:hypothetical protein TIFTF001_043764 [Ficus carica]|uniref:Uncharacterized protein n=1 Tax=Ficus carica TaxID=3494 RepID=A0AA88CN67_FICCA|nr:hypothetical protein TIFTF001_043764 [Ficus carica]
MLERRFGAKISPPKLEFCCQAGQLLEGFAEDSGLESRGPGSRLTWSMEQLARAWTGSGARAWVSSLLATGFAGGLGAIWAEITRIGLVVD